MWNILSRLTIVAWVFHSGMWVYFSSLRGWSTVLFIVWVSLPYLACLSLGRSLEKCNRYFRLLQIYLFAAAAVGPTLSYKVWFIDELDPQSGIAFFLVTAIQLILVYPVWVATLIYNELARSASK